MSKFVIVKGGTDQLELAVTALINATVPTDPVSCTVLADMGILIEGSSGYTFTAKYAGNTFTVSGGIVKVNDSIFMQALTGTPTQA